MSFKELSLSNQLQETIQRQGYTHPTPIQEQTIPHILQGKDVVGIAQTGTGKTGAFNIPIIQHFTNPKPLEPRKPQALILAPTRELAAQIDADLKTFSKGLGLRTTAIFGGVGQRQQTRKLKQGLHVLVATPGRLLDLHGQGHVKFDHIEIFVCDEADRMLDMGFLPDVKRVLKHVPRNRQTLFFSATWSNKIQNLSQKMLDNPVKVEVEPQASTVDAINQKLLYVDSNKKKALLRHLLRSGDLDKVLVFTRTKRKANQVSKNLNKKGFNARPIHGNKSQSARTKALNAFRNNNINVLVATDIAARGIDVDDITHVIQYDLPDDTEAYVHRIGRTGRAGKNGAALAFCAAHEKHKLRKVQRLIKQSIPVKQHRHHSKKAEKAKP